MKDSTTNDFPARPIGKESLPEVYNHLYNSELKDVAVSVDGLTTYFPERTAEYLARRGERVAALRQQLQRLLTLNRRLTVEIGCGHGHFLTAYAAQCPERFCLGLDIVKDRIQRARRKRDRARLSNLEFILGEARETFASLPEEVRVGEYFILFPDPWPKRRHHKNRILQSDFLTTLAAVAEPGARLCFRTDYAPYFEDARETVSRHPAWAVVDEPWPFELETVFQARAPKYYSLICRRSPPAISAPQDPPIHP